MISFHTYPKRLETILSTKNIYLMRTLNITKGKRLYDNFSNYLLY